MKPRRRSRPNSIGGQFAVHPVDMMESPAWRALSLSARRCLERIEIELAHHGGCDNGELPVAYRYSCDFVWRGTIKPVLAELAALGFIEMTPGYACQNPLYGRAARFRILARDGRDEPPADLFGMLSPTHETIAAFEKGGPACTRAVERLYEKLLDDELDEVTGVPVATPCEESDTGRSRRWGSLSKQRRPFERTPRRRCENG